jgi:hypothetical protein
MFAIVVRESGDPAMINASGQMVEENVLPRAREAPGFASGLWMTDQTGGTLNVLIFETQQAAQAALEPVRNAPRPQGMSVERADIYEVLARG